MTDNMGNGTLLSDIVVGVDGSDESFAALRWALRESRLTGQRVNAVYGWTRSWDMGAEPDTEEGWQRLRERIAERLKDWVDEAVAGMDVPADAVTLTSVHASGTAALLRIGKDAQQIVVGRRSLGRVARWFTGSFSASLAEEATVPVTVVRMAHDEDETMQDAIANALSSSETGTTGHDRQPAGGDARPVVVGVDGSATSRRALEFAAHEARVHGVPLQVLFCWQLRDLGTVPGFENAIASVEAGQKRAEQILDEVLADHSFMQGLDVEAHAFHIAAAKGLITASRYAGHLVVGSRGLSGLDAHFLGSVSKQLVALSECTLTVVH
ncbi:universal stress protein [Bifidobacterium aerophilum]|uniref:Universal stress protein n=2 Tax=Bifidobacterium aerophilum TaxID=1798155 RepID=A0A6N9Z3U6_9BIFI|nr:universal stress protein [Bifidobacterium aerophilum]NEG88885.1 universal stress protein [Bifidobacterium aerophilum]